MLIPDILPDEFVCGYLSRIRILNAFPNNQRTMKAISPGSLKSINKNAGTPVVMALASAADVDCQTLVRRHSMIPFISAIAPLDLMHAHGDPSSVNRLARFGMREVRGAAFFCPDCVTEDLDVPGIQYWRRNHQIPGIDWCQKHGTPLKSVPPAGFDDLPPCDDTCTEAYPPCSERDHPVIRRYTEVVRGLMDLAAPLYCTEVSRRLGMTARAAGLRVSPTGRRQLLSDLAQRDLPLSWLKRHFPQVAEKKELVYLSIFDGVCEPRSASFTTRSYALAAALLFPSACDAIQQLTMHFDVVPPKKTNNNLLINDNGRDKQLRQTYVACMGQPSVVARRLRVEPKHMKNVLVKLGLPSLSNLNNVERSAMLSFLDGARLEDVCAKSQIDPNQLTDLLRAACKPLHSALLEMQLLSKELN